MIFPDDHAGEGLHVWFSFPAILVKIPPFSKRNDDGGLMTGEGGAEDSDVAGWEILDDSGVWSDLDDRDPVTLILR